MEADEIKSNKPKKRRVLLTVLSVLLALALLVVGTGLFLLQRWRSGQWQPSAELRQALKRTVDATDLGQKAKTLKADLKELAVCLSELDLTGAQEARTRMQQDLAEVKRELDSPLLLGGSVTPVVGEEIRSVRELTALLDEADETLIGPVIALMEEKPLTALSGSEGIRVDLLLAWMEFGEQALPQAEAMLTRLEGLDLRLVDTDGKLASYMDKLSALLDKGESVRAALPAFRAILGGGSDRLYLFAAQNSSEIRASGGFPGSMGLIRIRDGLLSISDFQSVYQLLQKDTPASAQITSTEEQLFSGRLHLSWDSDFSPDFERAASIWALAYEARSGEKVDGVVSGTPAVIPRLLSFLGEIELSDGTVLNGENAGRVLGHDLYFNYLGAIQQAGAAELVDGLFAEAARSTLQLVFSHLNAKSLLGFLSFFEESTADRTLMIWLADEEEQALIRELGWNAGLNTDPAKPALGIFFNSTSASKTCWFLNIEPELSEGAVNEDGSRSYELTVRFVNTITDEELRLAGGYILGGSYDIIGSVYVFAPAGGRIEEARLESGYPMLRAVYEELELAYMLEMHVSRAEPLVLHCVVTTAPGAEAPMGLMVTPTMQEFR